VNATAWSRGLEVTAGGTGVVSRVGLVLLRQLADRTGPTAGLAAALPSPGGGLVISDFRVRGDQGEVFGPAASVPTRVADAEGKRRQTAAGWRGRHPGPCPVSDYGRPGRMMRRSGPDLCRTTISAMSSRAMTAGVIVPAQSKPETVAG
jgi:hypothetical protein